jgi:hypothetical protein
MLVLMLGIGVGGMAAGMETILEGRKNLDVWP